MAGRNDTVIAQSPGMVKRIKKIASQTSACSSVAHSEERSRIKNKKRACGISPQRNALTVVIIPPSRLSYSWVPVQSVVVS